MNPAPADIPATAAELMRLLDARGAVRDFRPDPVPEEWLGALLRAGQRAPTSSNIQACSVVVVRQPALREQLAALARNQRHIVDCPVYLVFCADLSRAAAACEAHGTKLDDTLESGMVATIDAALVGMTVSIAAEAMGLASVFIGAMRNHPREVAQVLGLPPRVYAVFGMCLGWPEAPPLPKPRMPLETFVHQDRYDTGAATAALAAYDTRLAAWYRAQGRQTTDDSWTRSTAKAFSVSKRKALREELLALGFKLE